MYQLSESELVSLVKSVFPPLAGDKALAILVDFPHQAENDTEVWANRRQLARQWASELQANLTQLGLESVDLVGYPAVDSNNADLPNRVYFLDSDLPALASQLEDSGVEIPTDELFGATDIFIALTQLSATAPLKVAAKQYRFRAATMPGFSEKMIPALRIDYALVSQRCRRLKELLDAAESATVDFVVDEEEQFRMHFDLRFRPAHESSGRFPEPGTAGNLPSGETYIVPYEGEKEKPSATEGTLPVQFKDEIVLFEVRENRAVGVLSEGEQSAKQAEYLQKEPAYGNMAELGFGVLGDFGLKPIGEVLLDEKLGFHIAFGRSDHFGGATGPDKFSSPNAVVHIDRIYIPETQPRIQVKSVLLDDDIKLMENGAYLEWQ